jgi:hypothetical protein
MRKRSRITIANCQVKSIEIARELCKALDTIEKICGIESVVICFEQNFICPDIDLTLLSNSSDPMERLIGQLLIHMDKAKRGHHSQYIKKPQV